jgi:hypothetical protein
MSTTKQRDPSKEQLWRRILRLWRKSDLSVRDFCRYQGLAEPSFYAWRRTLAQRADQSVHFVPVQVTPASAATTTDACSTGLELVLSGGRRVRIGPAFDDATLRRLLTLLEEGRP